MKRPALALAAAIGGLLVAQPAFAESVEVHHSDLDLSTAEGREELDRRVDAAARKVCGLDDIRTGTRIRSRDARECYKDARAQISQRIARLTENQAVGS